MGISKANGREPTRGDWRELALRVQQETDSQKMIELVEQLLTKFDEEEARKNLPPIRRTDSPAA